MPMYDYSCARCEMQFEAIRPVSHREAAQCPSCQSPTQVELSRATAAGIVSRSGWVPQSHAQRLAGASIRGPGTRSTSRRSNVLHVCAGKNCSYCGT